MKSRPLADRILVKPDIIEKKPEENVWLPEEKACTGTVIKAGRGKMGYNDLPIPTEPQPGDKVLYGKHSGIDIPLDGEEYLLMRENEIYLIL